MASIKKWLDASGFDWEEGVLIMHRTPGEDSPGWSSDVSERVIVGADDSDVVREFDSGYGGPECPRFFAADKRGIYFPSQYDGATWCEFIVTDPIEYLKKKSMTPYPGG